MLVPVALLLGIGMSWFFARHDCLRQMASGQTFPVFWTSLALIFGLPLRELAAIGFPMSFDFLKKSTLKLTGGFQTKLEFLALYLLLSFYAAAFIAEIVRFSINGEGGKGQTKVSAALGLHLDWLGCLRCCASSPRRYTSQYLNLAKGSSLAISIGYPDLVAFGGTVFN